MLAWGGFSAVLGALCLWRGYRQVLPAGGFLKQTTDGCFTPRVGDSWQPMSGGSTLYDKATLFQAYIQYSERLSTGSVSVFNTRC